MVEGENIYIKRGQIRYALLEIMYERIIKVWKLLKECVISNNRYEFEKD